MKKLIGLLVIANLYILNTYAQHKFELGAEFRPRFEQRLGYRTLASDGNKSAFFISERLRLNALYNYKFINLYVSLQDYRVWGNEEQVKNFGSFGLHEGWAEFDIKKVVSFKMGRQELSYEDNRLLGNLDWVQQARSHDGLVIKFQKKNTKLHVGSVFNQSTENTFGTVYKLNNYKFLNYAWLNQKFDSSRVSLSYYLISDGIPNKDSIPTTFFRVTTGPRVELKYKHVSANASFYVQSGKTINNNKILAFMATVYAEYTSPKINVGLGYDYLSGNNASKTSDKKYKAFHTLYPTNHKFYGHMDYFLDIPTDTKSGGLQDAYLRINYKPKPKGMLGADAHYFFLANKVAKSGSTTEYLKLPLGFEMDIYGSYKPLDFLTINAGYSFMLASSSMEAIKGGDRKHYNGWSYVMLTLKPTLFKHERE